MSGEEKIGLVKKLVLAIGRWLMGLLSPDGKTEKPPELHVQASVPTSAGLAEVRVEVSVRQGTQPPPGEGEKPA